MTRAKPEVALATPTSRIEFLADWAWRDPKFGRAQIEREAGENPELRYQVEQQLAIRDEFSKAKGMWWLALGGASK